jgi:hypothetical protein
MIGRSGEGEELKIDEEGAVMKKLSMFVFLLLIVTTFSLGFAFDKVKFAVISDPIFRFPSRRGLPTVSSWG